MWDIHNYLQLFQHILCHLKENKEIDLYLILKIFLVLTLTQSLSQSGTTINLKNAWYNSSQKNGFPDEGEVLIPFYDTVENVWIAERILYGAVDVSNETLTVATGGRGYQGTTAAAHDVVTGTYTFSGTSCTVTTSSNHNLSTGQRILL